MAEWAQIAERVRAALRLRLYVVDIRRNNDAPRVALLRIHAQWMTREIHPAQPTPARTVSPRRGAAPLAVERLLFGLLMLRAEPFPAGNDSRATLVAARMASRDGHQTTLHTGGRMSM